MKRLQRGSLKAEGNWWRLRYWEKAINAEGKLIDKRRTAVIGPAKGPDRLTKTVETLHTYAVEPLRLPVMEGTD